jgi:predicted nucleic acid-binding protein
LSRIELDPGEAEAIALGLELGRTLPLLLDDKKGRRVAKRVGPLVIGSAGILVIAKERRLIAENRPLLSQVAGKGLYLNGVAAATLVDLVDE